MKILDCLPIADESVSVAIYDEGLSPDDRRSLTLGSSTATPPTICSITNTDGRSCT